MFGKTAGSVIRKVLSIARGRKNLPSALRSSVYSLKLPLAADDKTGWKPYPVFNCCTSRGNELACHISVLSPGIIPHAVHRHPEEEILILLSGALDLYTSEDQVNPENPAFRIRPGQLFLYPADFPHTIRSTGSEPAQYVMIKWSSAEKRPGTRLKAGLYSTSLPGICPDSETGFRPYLLFEGGTASLEKLQCHLSLLAPGAGYPPHADPYDVVLLMLEGEAVTQGTRIVPHDVVLYAPGEPHSMQNPAAAPARYLVCEFHW
jgi:mannose-6-phosphate isomerase-like protein (cupin superfamily)